MILTKLIYIHNRLKLSVTLIFIGVVASCLQVLVAQTRQNFQVYDISDAFNTGQTIFLSGICNEIEYVRLETQPGLTIGKPDIIDVGGKYIVIADTKKLQAWLFTRQGRFVRNLGKSGKLPGEYSSLRNLSLSWNEQWAAIFDSKEGKIILYATESDQIREIKAGGGPGEVIFGSANYLLASWTYPLSLINGYHQFSWIDITSGKGAPFCLVPDKVRKWGSILVPVHRQQNELVVDQLYNDTAYSIRSSGYPEPRISFKIGANRFPAESYGDHAAYVKNIGICSRTGPWVQSGPWVFMKGWNRLEERHILYNILENTATSLIRFDDLRDRVIDNNVDGGPAFWFDGLTSAGDVFQVISAERIFRLKEAGYLFKYHSGDPVAVEKFRKVLDGISVTDNPVIQILKVKDVK